ncbi:MAG: MBL fold metallo-hydrolase [Oscillochloris sp.]|nr:MBL fold metallo-hydrolase [Oscillochloris sp.]
MARVILLGTGTGLPDIDRGHTHMLWDGQGGPLLIDVGGDSYQRLLKAGIDPQELAGIVLTHSHCDHINGLPALLFSMALGGRKATLPIYGLPETLTIAAALLEACRLDGLHPDLDWRTIDAGASVDLGAGWRMRTALTAHSRPCFGLRWEAPDGSVPLVYSADTEPCPAGQTLAAGAGVLIHEATTPEPFPGHTTPQQAGVIAAAAGARNLILVHYSPRWTMPEPAALDAIRAGGFSGAAQIGRDGQVITLV